MTMASGTEWSSPSLTDGDAAASVGECVHRVAMVGKFIF